MSQYLNKAEYNQDFLNKLETDFPYDFWDWKVTVAFYVSIHCLQGLAEIKGERLGTSHSEIWANLKSDKTLGIDKETIKNYGKLYNHSISSRYDGFMTQESFNRIQEMNYNDSKVYLERIKAFLKSQCQKESVNHSFLS